MYYLIGLQIQRVEKQKCWLESDDNALRFLPTIRMATQQCFAVSTRGLFKIQTDLTKFQKNNRGYVPQLHIMPLLLIVHLALTSKVFNEVNNDTASSTRFLPSRYDRSQNECCPHIAFTPSFSAPKL